MLKQLCIQAHSSSLRCGGSLCKFQHDKLYNASHCKLKCAFTLAEVLITLVIIGVIAALTIPNLLQKYQEQATVKSVKKFYSTLSNAYSLAQKENGNITEWGLTGRNQESTEKVYEILIKPYFKIAKNCEFDTSNKKGCFYAWIDAGYKVVLDDGASLAFYASGSSGFVVFYDVNGNKKPNKEGYDRFLFGMSSRSKMPYPYGLDISYMTFDTKCQPNTSNYGCAAWVVYKENMDYLHCDGLTWNSRSCKEK